MANILGLNPFFIRAFVQTLMAKKHHYMIGLNPFFIRAFVQTSITQDKGAMKKVLIPSLSGHSFKPYVEVVFADEVRS